MIFKEIAYNSPEWRTAVALREKILRLPLGTGFTEEELAEEASHIQIAGFQGEKLIAAAVLVPEEEAMKMQRVVVEENLRSASIGSQMMEFCEQIAMRRNATIMYCHARDSAVNFYLKNNYLESGDYFEEDGIPHVKMIKELPTIRGSSGAETRYPQ